MMARQLLTKEQMIDRLDAIAKKGWIRSLRPLNSGGIGNTIDSLLGLEENNLPIADTAQWEMKSHRSNSASLLTLFHMEPEPKKERIVPKLLLPKYGWPDQTRPGEFSFRQTLRATEPTDRGFGLTVDDEGEEVNVYFNAELADARHQAWLQTVQERIGLGPLNPAPFWQMQSLFLKASTKMLNTFYVETHTRRQEKDEFFAVARVQVLQGFSIDRFIVALRQGNAFIDFDARTKHNHGTKFRLRQNIVPSLYQYADTAIGPLFKPG